jgi:hypothetical protein
VRAAAGDIGQYAMRDNLPAAGRVISFGMIAFSRSLSTAGAGVCRARAR